MAIFDANGINGTGGNRSRLRREARKRVSLFRKSGSPVILDLQPQHTQRDANAAATYREDGHLPVLCVIPWTKNCCVIFQGFSKV